MTAKNGLLRNVKIYLLRPEAGAGLLFVALAFGVLRLWVERLFVTAGMHPYESLVQALSPENPRFHFFAWTVVSLALAAWLAFVLLRRRLTNRGLQRVLLVAVVHAVGAVRFYDWGLMLLSVLPLFALVPAVLLPPPNSRD